MLMIIKGKDNEKFHFPKWNPFVLDFSYYALWVRKWLSHCWWPWTLYRRIDFLATITLCTLLDVFSHFAFEREFRARVFLFFFLPQDFISVAHKMKCILCVLVFWTSNKMKRCPDEGGKSVWMNDKVDHCPECVSRGFCL